uniref:Uncharacterized protein n=1 Tax=Cacopsylla melanoneura TaxID=428564 RepID=A0A8D8W5A7_9HEMI
MRNMRQKTMTGELKDTRQNTMGIITLETIVSKNQHRDTLQADLGGPHLSKKTHYVPIAKKESTIMRQETSQIFGSYSNYHINFSKEATTATASAATASPISYQSNHGEALSAEFGPKYREICASRFYTERKSTIPINQPALPINHIRRRPIHLHIPTASQTAHGGLPSQSK